MIIKLKSLLKEDIHSPPSEQSSKADIIHHSTNNTFSPDFLNYIKTVENGIKKGFDKNKNLWYPYQDSAGWNIGYGHFLRNQNEIELLRKTGISDSNVNKLLISDLTKAEKNIHDYIKNKYETDLVLSERQKEILVDFIYNLGNLNSFPKFIDAVLRNNMDIMRKEYKRSAAGKELTGRNKAFFERFL